MRRAATRFFRLVLPIGLLLFLAACASDGPRWVKGRPPGDYPADRYSWGVGSAARTEAAAKAATADLARKTGGEEEGAQIARTWFDEKKSLHWALAVLDRPAQLEKLSAELAATDARLVETRASATPGEPLPRAFAALLEAIELASARDALATRIGRLGGTPGPADPANARARLVDELIALKHGVTIDVEAWEMDPTTGAPGEPLDPIRTAIARDLVNRGFRIGPTREWGPGGSALTIRARVGIEALDLGSSDRFVAVEWNATAEIEDGQGEGEILAILTQKARTTQLNAHEARRQARSQAEAFLVDAVARWFDERTEPRGAARTSGDGSGPGS